jgi:hypothetical protein
MFGYCGHAEREKGVVELCQDCRDEFLDHGFGLKKISDGYNGKYICDFCEQKLIPSERTNLVNENGLCAHLECWNKFITGQLGYIFWHIKILLESSDHDDYCSDNECDYSAKTEDHLCVTKDDIPTSQHLVHRNSKHMVSGYCTNSKMSTTKNLNKHQLRYTLIKYKKLHPFDHQDKMCYEWQDTDLTPSEIFQETEY